MSYRGRRPQIQPPAGRTLPILHGLSLTPEAVDLCYRYALIDDSQLSVLLHFKRLFKLSYGHSSLSSIDWSRQPLAKIYGPKIVKKLEKLETFNIQPGQRLQQFYAATTSNKDKEEENNRIKAKEEWLCRKRREYFKITALLTDLSALELIRDLAVLNYLPNAVKQAYMREIKEISNKMSAMQEIFADKKINAVKNPSQTAKVAALESSPKADKTNRLTTIAAKKSPSNALAPEAKLGDSIAKPHSQSQPSETLSDPMTSGSTAAALWNHFPSLADAQEIKLLRTAVAEMSKFYQI